VLWARLRFDGCKTNDFRSIIAIRPYPEIGDSRLADAKKVRTCKSSGKDRQIDEWPQHPVCTVDAGSGSGYGRIQQAASARRSRQFSMFNKP
jgi:hypothetical protein